MSIHPLYDEKKLLSKVAEGDDVAFRQLYYYWQPQLAAYIFRITESREMTEEIVQDVFLKIWIVRESLNEIDNFKNFLLVVSRNHARNALRSVMREKKRKEDWKKNSIDLAPNDKDAEIYSEQLTVIDEAIKQLPPQQKKVYLLHRREGLTYNQIAENLSISKETVRDHLRLSVASISKFVRSKLLPIIFLMHGLEIF